MKISPQLQTLLYGTVVAGGVAIGGALWHSRSTPGGHAKMVDYIEVYQSCLEKCLATEYWTGNPTNFPPAPAVYTNCVVNWITDPSGRGYYIHSTNGATWHTNASGRSVLVAATNSAVWTNYLAKSGETDDVYTNALNRTYKTPLPNPGLNVELGYPDDGSVDELTGGTDRYIWNAYSNITLTGLLPSGANGSYAYMTNARFTRKSSLVSTAIVDRIINNLWTTLGNSDYTYVYTNTVAGVDRFLFDLGPRDSGGKRSPGDGTMSIVIVRRSGTSGIREALTYRGDSLFNGPWFRYGYTTPITNFTATGTGFSSNLMRSALCRWYIAKSGPWAVYGDYDWHSYDGVTPSYEDPRYWKWGLNAIPPDLKSYQFANLILKLNIPYDPPVRESSLIHHNAYLDHHQASAGTFVNITNRTDWNNLLLTWTGVCASASISTNHTFNQPPTTGDVEYVSKALKEFQWSWLGGVVDPWLVPGALTNATPLTNCYAGVGSSYSSWAAAKADAVANLHPSSRGAGAPYAYTYGNYGATVYPGSTTKVWAAYIYASADEVAYMGACTSIVHTADIYVLANKYDGLSYTNNVFDANGVSGLIEGQYAKVATVGPGSDPFPRTQVGTIGALPAWCEDPALHTVRTDYGDHYVLLGGAVRGYQVDDAEIVMKWGWNYNNP